MGMLKVRLKKLRLMKRNFSSSRRSRTDRAVKGCWTLRNKPDFVIALITERECIRSEICVIALGSSSDAPELISRRLKRINTIDKKLTERRA